MSESGNVSLLLRRPSASPQQSRPKKKNSCHAPQDASTPHKSPRGRSLKNIKKLGEEEEEDGQEGGRAPDAYQSAHVHFQKVRRLVEVQLLQPKPGGRYSAGFAQDIFLHP